MAFRKEKDSLGEKLVPDKAYYGIQTLRAVENFPISGFYLPPEMIAAIAKIKIAAARANIDLKKLDKKKGSAIIKASSEILEGKFDDHFPVDAFQAGAGTSSHMNLNEVIANRACEILGGNKGDYNLVHPNDHVNMGQSTNDVIPTAMRIAALPMAEKLLHEMKQLEDTFNKKGEEFKNIIKSGRTHLQDAVPMALGNEFKAYGENVKRWRTRITRASESLEELGIGGSAVGSGINTQPRYRGKVVKYLGAITGLNLKPAKDLFEAMQSMAPFTEVSGALKNFALDLVRICNDLRLLSSGPRTGLSEIVLPPVQPGSSIMPGKVNPVIAEMTDMAAFQVIGNDLVISMAAQAGQLELNVMMPVITFNLIFSLKILTGALSALREKCVKGIKANKETCKRYAESSLGLATVLNPYIGYQAAAEVAKESYRTGKSIVDIIREKKLMDEEGIKKIFK
ncbi:MAG: aspartate ammonia-lyase [Candidatus Schekmanbacteria bacterium RBG_16_38_11]|uniref:Aspartate ammonia-lyase n=1 Tax=Candidatus Schekmanbacteria bacterium RBG_16_38_11 TaxID=1817880 RepID=A0A1F7S017_9BACT|nr:MAG: aspartate ammonia-lyase [Candidatus Schekmanbacteria bacterium RBG_16_38_11]